MVTCPDRVFGEHRGYPWPQIPGCRPPFFLNIFMSRPSGRLFLFTALRCRNDPATLGRCAPRRRSIPGHRQRHRPAEEAGMRKNRAERFDSRSEERREVKVCDRTYQTRWTQTHKKTKTVK